MQKRLFSILCCLSFSGLAISQTMNKCATMPVYDAHSQNTSAKTNFLNVDLAAKNWLANPLNKAKFQYKTNS